MSQLETYYNEHATHARQHEDHREHITSAILALAGILITLITFAQMSLRSLPAAISLVFLGLLGFLAAGKHYERFRMHTTIMEKIRDEMDRVSATPGAQAASLSTLRNDGLQEHYKNFAWPWPPEKTPALQANAKAWIARRRTRFFWELLHVGVAVIGLTICLAIIVRTQLPKTGGAHTVRALPTPIKK